MLLTDILIHNKEKVALRYPERSFKYYEIAQMLDSASLLLLRSGCKIGDVVAIAGNKRPWNYILMLAALRVGVAYVNLDTESPIERNLKILNTCSPHVLFYDDTDNEAEINELAAANGILAQLLEDPPIKDLTLEEKDLLSERILRVDAACIAYIMFTSGSTGTPKGVAITHQNLLHFIEWGRTRFNVGCEDNFANLSPLYFDNSVFDFYIALFSGASLTPIHKSLLSQPYKLISFIEKMQCTVWFSVPSLLIYLVTMKAFSIDSINSLKQIIFGGEGYPKIELKKLYDIFSSRTSIVNVYGPTECTCICSAHTLSDDDFDDLSGLPTLGKLNQNFDYLIIDDEGIEANIGELCLIGPNVASGYFNDLDRTQNAFTYITDKQRFMKKMYLTGDIVREADGMLHFVGRKDNQIKHMGYRIELEEIEHALTELKEIAQTAVVYKRDKSSYGKIVAFASVENTEVDERVILHELANYLPAYMIPSKLILMDVLPKNANGKVDRKALLSTLYN
jgi:D-alanine--poly(phosphoribitol) ligase subunit 1